MPQVWIGTSWKMNKTLAEAGAFAGALLADPEGDARIQRFVIPPFTVAREVKAMLKDTSVKVGAQNMHWADEGAWTGEISPVMLKDCDLDIVELGLFYDAAIEGDTVKIVHSLTSMGCPAGPMIQEGIHDAVAALPGVGQVEVELTFDPPWTPDRMSDDAKFILGFG